MSISTGTRIGRYEIHSKIILMEQVKPLRWRPAFYSPADNRIEKVYDFPLGVGGWTLDEHTLIYRKKDAGITTFGPSKSTVAQPNS